MTLSKEDQLKVNTHDWASPENDAYRECKICGLYGWIYNSVPRPDLISSVYPIPTCTEYLMAQILK